MPSKRKRFYSSYLSGFFFFFKLIENDLKECLQSCCSWDKRIFTQRNRLRFIGGNIARKVYKKHNELETYAPRIYCHFVSVWFQSSSKKKHNSFTLPILYAMQR